MSVDRVPDKSISESISVLHLDDDPDLAEVAKLYLEKEIEVLEVTTENTPEEALARIREEEIDCIVCDYDMPEMTGLEFLEAVRDQSPDIPFILYTGKGSEEIASEAISRGVTDYLQKSTSQDQYTVLANRIQNAVSQYRAEQRIEWRSKWYQRILEHSSDYVMIVNEMGKVRYVSPAIERVMGYEPREIIGDDSFANIHPDDLEFAAEALSGIITDPEKEVTVEFRAEAKDGSYRWLEVRGRNFLDEPVIEGVIVNVRDITERKKREQQLEEHKDRLQELTNFLSHDVKNLLNIITARIGFLKDEDSTDSNIRSVTEAANRIEEIIDKVQELSKSNQDIAEAKPVAFSVALEQCWRNIEDSGMSAEVIVGDDIVLLADEERLRTLLENVLRNAVDHGGPEVTIQAGRLAEDDGFYIEDDGPGMSCDEQEKIFTPGFSTADDGTGLGLVIVKRISEAHGWDITVTESEMGGTRFEFRGVECAE